MQAVRMRHPSVPSVNVNDTPERITMVLKSRWTVGMIVFALHAALPPRSPAQWGGFSFSPASIDISPPKIGGELRKIDGEISSGAKDAREDVQRQGKNLREDVQRAGKNGREDLQRQGKAARENAQRWGKDARENAQRKTKQGEARADDQIWGEFGRRAYPAAAAIQLQRYPNSRTLSTAFRSALAANKLYGDIDLSRVFVHWGARPINEWTVGGKTVDMLMKGTVGQTFGYDIYLIYPYMSPMDGIRVEKLVHELTHVRQYVRLRSSLENFGYYYFRDYRRANNDYYNNAMEAEAFAVEYSSVTGLVYNSYLNILQPASSLRLRDQRSNRARKSQWADDHVHGEVLATPHPQAVHNQPSRLPGQSFNATRQRSQDDQQAPR
jgi:hypothetical protein